MTCFNIISAIAVLFFSNNRFFGNGADAAALFINGDLYTAIAGLLVVLTTALQYVLKLEVKSKDAKSAGNDFTCIKREIELLLCDQKLSVERARAIQISHSHASRNHELVPKKNWDASKSQTKQAFLEDKAFEDAVMTRFGLNPALLEPLKEPVNS